MRAIVVEFAGEDDAAALAVLDGAAGRLGSGEAGAPARGDGHLVAIPPDPDRLRPTEGEPL